MKRLLYALAAACCLIPAQAAAQDGGPADMDAGDEAAPSDEDAAPSDEDAAPSDEDAAPSDEDAGEEAGNDDAGDDESCFSPTQNVDLAYDEEAVGCACDPEVDENACVDGVGLTCDEGFWVGVDDGTCWKDETPEAIPLCAAGAPGSRNAAGSLALLAMVGAVAASRSRKRRGR